MTIIKKVKTGNKKLIDKLSSEGMKYIAVDKDLAAWAYHFMPFYNESGEWSFLVKDQLWTGRMALKLNRIRDYPFLMKEEEYSNTVFEVDFDEFIEHEKTPEKKVNKMKDQTIKKAKQQLVDGARRASIDNVTIQILDHLKTKVESEGAKQFIDSAIGKIAIPLVVYKAAEIATEGQTDGLYKKLNKIATAGSAEYTQQVLEKLLPDMNTIINIVGLVSADLIDSDE